MHTQKGQSFPDSPPLSIVQPLSTSDPSISKPVVKQGEKKKAGRGLQEKHTHQKSPMMKGASDHSELKCSGHSYKMEPLNR